LWAFEAISAWLRRLGDDDELKQLSYVNEKLPQDTWLVLAEVQEAEHDPQVTICTHVRTFKVVHVTCDVHVYIKNICVHVYFAYYAYMVCG